MYNFQNTRPFIYRTSDNNLFARHNKKIKLMSNSTLFGTLSIVNYSITKQGYVNGFLCKTSKNAHCM